MTITAIAFSPTTTKGLVVPFCVSPTFGRRILLPAPDWLCAMLCMLNVRCDGLTKSQPRRREWDIKVHVSTHCVLLYSPPIVGWLDMVVIIEEGFEKDPRFEVF